MSRFDRAVINRLEDKFEIKEDNAKELVSIVREIAADEYEKKFEKNIPF